MTLAKQQQLTRKPDTHIHYLHLVGLDDVPLFAAVSDSMGYLKVILDAVGLSGTEALFRTPAGLALLRQIVRRLRHLGFGQVSVPVMLDRLF